MGVEKFAPKQGEDEVRVASHGSCAPLRRGDGVEVASREKSYFLNRSGFKSIKIVV